MKNEDNGNTVTRLSSSNGDVVCVDTLAMVNADKSLKSKGGIALKNFGKQIKMQHAQRN